MNSIAAFAAVTLSLLASVAIFALGALLLLAYVLVAGTVGLVRWVTGAGRHRRPRGATVSAGAR